MSEEKGWPWNICRLFKPEKWTSGCLCFIETNLLRPCQQLTASHRRRATAAARGLILPCLDAAEGGRLMAVTWCIREASSGVKMTKQEAHKVTNKSDSSWLWCFVCGDAPLWNKEVQRVGGRIVHHCHTITAKEMLSKERRRKMCPPFIRHNHPQAALISQEVRQTESILAPLHEGRMKNACVYMHQTPFWMSHRGPECPELELIRAKPLLHWGYLHRLSANTSLRTVSFKNNKL